MGAADVIRNPRRVRSVGDLLGCVWQVGYVTSDLERACDLLAGDLGLCDFAELPARHAMNFEDDQPIEPWHGRFALAARGDLVIELVEPVSGAVDFYRRALPGDGSFAIRFHHLAVSVANGDAEWDRLRRLLGRSGLSFDHGIVIPNRIRAAYVDATPQLGHMIEICQMAPQTRAFYLQLLSGARSRR